MALQDAEAQKQIKQMRNFILNEARDKAQEIEAKTLEDFNLEKLKLLQQMKNKVRQEFQQAVKRLENERAIERSVIINKYRLQKIQTRYEIFQKLRALTEQELIKLTESASKYEQLCAELIAQAAILLSEEELIVQCRKKDEELVKSCLNKAATLYAEAMKKQSGTSKSVSISIDTKIYLPPEKSSKDPSAQYCLGGIKVMTQNKHLDVDNTLDSRLDMVMQQCMPDIRRLLSTK